MTEDMLAIFMVFSIPLVSIIGAFYIKILRIKMEGNRHDQGQDEELALLKKQVDYLLAEQQDLREQLGRLQIKEEGYRIPESEWKQEPIDLKKPKD